MALTTKPRWDKYDGYVGNYRAVLGVDIDLETESNKVLGVGLNSDGAIVVGSGQTGIKGLLIVAVGADIHGNYLDGGINNKIGDVQDIGKHGEITNFVPSDVASVAGTNYYAHADGSVTATKGGDGIYVGHTVEADRLIVNVLDATP
jgi:hypothetical protein